jgi:ferredoxin
LFGFDSACSGPRRGPEQARSATIWLPNNQIGCSSSCSCSASCSAKLSTSKKMSTSKSNEDRAELGWPEGPRTTLNLQIRFQKKSLEIAETYNKQSILAITCLLGDFVTLLTLYILFVLPQMKPQVIILKSFLTESLYSLSDTTKSFLLILGMDLLVGFHSPRGWEIVLENALRHFGLPENESFILLFVALFPVFLDTVFKYWIFRYLNKISPSTVVTYHSMLE